MSAVMAKYNPFAEKAGMKKKAAEQEPQREILRVSRVLQEVEFNDQLLGSGNHVFQNTQESVPIFDKENPLKSTAKMMTWYTSRPCEIIKKSHISHVVFDSTWEASEAFELDRNKSVLSWAKNDHLGFVINYVFRGVIHKFYPDFLIRLSNRKMLILEVKGMDDQQNKTKRQYLNEWINAVNSDGRFGKWGWAVSFRTSDIKDIINKHSN